MATREIFSSRFATLLTMVGVAVGLGNVWRFPYMMLIIVPVASESSLTLCHSLRLMVY